MTNLPAYIHATHDVDGAPLMAGAPGWIVVTEAIGHDPANHSGHDYRPLSEAGIGVVVRLNNAHDGVNGTIPLPHEYRDFARRCANFVATSEGIAAVIIGNEPNHSNEWPRENGRKVQIDPIDYARCYGECRSAIKSTRGDLPVLVAAIAPWNNEAGDWLAYLKRVVNQLWDGADGFALHAYTHGSDPALIFSDEMQHGWYWHFRVYRQQMVAIREIVKGAVASMLFIITETNQGDGAWLDVNKGWVQNAYKEIDNWNKLQPLMPIRFVAIYRTNRDDKWSIADKPGVQADFRAAVAKGYTAPPLAAQSGDKPFQTALPNISTGGDNPAPPPKPEPSRDIDPRLFDRGMKIDEGSGDKVWRLKEAKWFPSSESGGRHHIYVEAYDEAGNPVDVPFAVWYPGAPQPVQKFTNGKKGFDAGNFNMTPGEFNVWINDGEHDSDAVTGIKMGEDTPSGWNAGHHTSTGLVFRLEDVPAEQPPAPPAQPTQPAPSGVPVPRLVHPLGGGAKPVTQHFGENPADYARFGMAGHTGIDFGVPEGTPVYAVDDGVVQEAGELPDYGRYIKLTHPWGESVYAHLSNLHRTHGEFVSAGAQLGLSGNTGNSTGPHLHFAMRTYPYQRGAPYDGYVDPAPYLRDASTGAPQPPTPPVPAGNQYLPMVKAAAAEFGLPWQLIASQVQAESSYNPNAVSNAGAQGLMQLMPATWAEWSAKVGGGNNPFDPRQNLRVGTAYLNWLLDQTDGKLYRALIAYGWGIGNLGSGQTPPAQWVDYANKIIFGRDLLVAVGA